MNEQNIIPSEPVKKKGSKSLFVALIVVVLLVAVGAAGFFAYKHFTQNPTSIIKGVVNDAYEKFSKALKENEVENIDFDIKKDSMYVDGYLKFNDKKYAGLDDELINFEVGLDYKNKLAKAKAELESKKNNLIDILVQFQEDKMFLKSSNMFDNVYNMGEYKFDEMFNFDELDDIQYNVDDIDYVVRELKDAFLESLNDEEMSISKEKITIDGKEINTNKISYNIDEDSMDKMRKQISNSILNDDELVDKIASITGISSKEVKDALREFKQEPIDERLDGKFSIYTVGWKHDAVMVEFIDDDVRCYMTEKDDKVRFFYNDTEHEIQIDVVKNGDEYQIDVDYDEENVASFTVSGDDKQAVIDYDISVSNVDLNGTVEIVINSQTERNASGTIKMSLEGTIDKEKLDYEVESNYNLEVGKKIEQLESKKAIEEFTVADSEKMMSSLEKLQSTALFKYFSSKLGNMTGLL